MRRCEHTVPHPQLSGQASPGSGSGAAQPPVSVAPAHSWRRARGAGLGAAGGRGKGAGGGSSSPLARGLGDAGQASGPRPRGRRGERQSEDRREELTLGRKERGRWWWPQSLQQNRGLCRWRCGLGIADFPNFPPAPRKRSGKCKRKRRGNPSLGQKPGRVPATGTGGGREVKRVESPCKTDQRLPRPHRHHPTSTSF